MLTIRRTSGSTSRSVGKATSHDRNHAMGHVETNAVLTPRLFSVETPETISDIRMERANGITNAA